MEDDAAGTNDDWLDQLSRRGAGLAAVVFGAVHVDVELPLRAQLSDVWNDLFVQRLGESGCRHLTIGCFAVNPQADSVEGAQKYLGGGGGPTCEGNTIFRTIYDTLDH